MPNNLNFRLHFIRGNTLPQAEPLPTYIWNTPNNLNFRLHFILREHDSQAEPLPTYIWNVPNDLNFRLHFTMRQHDFHSLSAAFNCLSVITNYLRFKPFTDCKNEENIEADFIQSSCAESNCFLEIGSKITNVKLVGLHADGSLFSCVAKRSQTTSSELPKSAVDSCHLLDSFVRQIQHKYQQEFYWEWVL